MFLLLASLLAHAQSTPDWHPLHAASAQASSHLRSNWNKYDENYHPNYVLDDNPATAWVEGVEGDGIGERLTIPVSGLPSARAIKLQIRNGYQKSSRLLAANNIPKDVQIVVRGLRGEIAGKLDVKLKATSGWQDVVIPIGATATVQAVEITLKSVFPGKLYHDTCISDVRVFADSDVPYAPDVEARKQAELTAWVAGRIAHAQELAKVDATYPFASTSWRYDSDDVVAGAEAKAFVAPFLAQLADAPMTGAWYRLAPVRRFPEPDGLDVPWAPYLRQADVALFEAQDEGWHVVDKDDTPEADEGSWVLSMTHARRIMDGDRIRALQWQSREVVEARGSHTDLSDVRMTFDDQGRATAIVIKTYRNGDFDSGVEVRVLLLTWSETGQLTGVDSVRTQEFVDQEAPELNQVFSFADRWTYRPQ